MCHAGRQAAGARSGRLSAASGSGSAPPELGRMTCCPTTSRGKSVYCRFQTATLAGGGKPVIIERAEMP